MAGGGVSTYLPGYGVGAHEGERLLAVGLGDDVEPGGIMAIIGLGRSLQEFPVSPFQGRIV